MEITDFSALIFTIFFIFLLLKLGIKHRIGYPSKSNLPPGPRKLPFIGNIHQLAGSLPHHVLRELAKKYGPLMHLQVGEVSTIVVSSPETAKEVMKTHDIIFASRPHIIASQIISYNSTNIAFAPYGEYWRQLRKICTLELLSAKRVQSFHYIREEETSRMIQSIAGNGGEIINLTQKIYSAVSSIVLRAAFGGKCKDQESFVHVAVEAIKLGAGFSIPDIYPSIKFFHFFSGVKPKLERLLLQSDRILQNIVNEHKANYITKKDEPEACKDLVDVLLKYLESENGEFHLTEENIKAVLLDMFAAGTETSGTTIDWAMSEMLRNPTILKKAQEEVRQAFSSRGYINEEEFKDLKYLQAIIKETLRLHPALPLLLPRENSERCEIGGYEIPLKTKIIVNAWAINRDSRYWQDAESFIPERFLDSSVDYKGTHFEYIPFGAGRRICPGMTSGLANVEVILAKLLYQFNWDLPDGMEPEGLDMTEASGLTARRKADLYLVPKLHNPLLV
ncbi:hypothetical protein M9H77_15077 [Catharanthus roseus]|uniref:Uncharacterized protein n=1 Tax=Catharanthus roseus TaxID=4058 RepID=A0ACC0BQ97_CATRO|nr:hypothetical protein M9H77_15077 [Catharanthus roseus]